MAIQIQPADVSDHIELTQIARASKGYWGYPENWLSTWSEQLLITPLMIEKNQVFKAVGQEATAGFYVLIGTAAKMALDHLWVKPEFIGQGIGRLLFQHAMHQAAALGARQVEIESDPNALGFYLKMGAKQVGTRITIMDRELPLLLMEVDSAHL
jgi:ribosomal protein S18 acetylase RimI-like enzyme